MKHIRHDFKRFNSLEVKKIKEKTNDDVSTPVQKEKEIPKTKKKSKFFSNKNLEFNYNYKNNDNNFQVEIVPKNKLTSKKLPKINGVEEMEMNRINTNLIESNTNKSINKKQKNLKNVINNFEN